MKNVKYFDLITAKRSEYSDEVEKANKKQDLLLSTQIKILERQERVAGNILKKTIAEAQRLRDSVKDRSNRSLDLTVYDKKKAHARFSSSSPGNDVAPTTHAQANAGAAAAPVFLPPIHNSHAAASSQNTPRRRKSRDAGLYVRTQPKMLSMRALRDTSVPPPLAVVTKEKQVPPPADADKLERVAKVTENKANIIHKVLVKIPDTGEKSAEITDMKGDLPREHRAESA